MGTYSSRLSYANALKSALATQDKTMMAKLVHPDFVWALPGENAVSGETIGVEAMFDRFARLSEFGVNIEIQQVMVSPRGVAMTLHNTGSHNGAVLEEYLVSAVALRDDKAHRIDTYVSDILMMDAHFSKAAASPSSDGARRLLAGSYSRGSPPCDSHCMRFIAVGDRLVEGRGWPTNLWTLPP
jgi:ketosteroid isomerase-like protein